MNNPSHQDDVTITRASEILGVSAATLRNWDRAGKLTSSRHPINHYRIYSLSQLTALKRSMQEKINSATISEFPNSPNRPANAPDYLGQHMTPVPVGRQMAGFIQRPVTQWRVLDPACGDGNLLIAVAERMLEAGVKNISERLVGIDIDPEMIALTRYRLSTLLGVNPKQMRVFQTDFLEHFSNPLFGRLAVDIRDFNIIISNPPYGRGLEYKFFDACATALQNGSELIFLMPLSFLDRAKGLFSVPLDGRPLGVTTGHAIVRHVCGGDYSFRSVKEHQHNQSPFAVLSGVKIYELGGGNPKQTPEIIEKKPYSSSTPHDGWLPCLRTGDVRQFKYETGRLFVKYGDHLAHPKELERFQGPRLFVRRVPIWENRQIAAAYAEETILCAGDVLVVRHEENDKQLLQGLCKFLNSPQAAEVIFERRPSVRFRDSFPKLSAKDLNALFDSSLPSMDELRKLGQSCAAKTEPKRTKGKTIPQPPRRYIEVEFPVESVSQTSSKEKSIRQGHISTLQMWWARRPLAVCRATIFASIIPHPDSLEPNHQWLQLANEILPGQGTLSERLKNFIGTLSSWDVVQDQKTLGIARKLINATSNQTPTLIDTFAGGGSIPMESQRLGLSTTASDINPVAVSALKFALSMSPGNGDRLAKLFKKAVHEIGERLQAVAEQLFGVTKREQPLAFFWCRTIQCENCHVEVPLLKDYILADSNSKVVVTIEYSKKENRYEFKLNTNPTSQEFDRAHVGTVASRGATCPHCKTQTKHATIQELGERGKIGERLYAVRYRDSKGNIQYRLSDATDDARASNARLRKITPRRVNSVPSELLDMNGVRHSWAIQYGVKTTGDLYNRRQGFALLEVLHEMLCWLNDVPSSSDYTKDDVRAIRYLFAFLLNRLAMYNSRHSWWQSTGEFPANMFGRQAIPFVWNYVEMPFSSESAGGLKAASDWICKAAAHCGELPVAGEVLCADAANSKVEAHTIDIVAIDPPYYDSITYGYLSDVFYVWMRELLRQVEPQMFASKVCDKAEEAIVDRPHKLAPAPKTGRHFRKKMAQSFKEIARLLKKDGRAIVMFGHKTFEAWDAIMSPLLESGLRPIVSWPIHTERKTKFRHGKIAALSSSCVMVCEVKRNTSTQSIQWVDFLETHKAQLRNTSAHYRACKLYGADLLTAMAAPVLGCFAEYHKVIDGEKTLAPIDILKRLSGLMSDIQLSEMMEHEVLRSDPHAVSWLERLKAGESKSVEDGSPLLQLATNFSKALAEGNGSVADELWVQASENMKAGLQNLFEAASILLDENSGLYKLILASLGRISLAQRSHL